MSEIEKLIQELCPKGVPFKKLEEVCVIKTEKGITQKQYSENGLYPLISGGHSDSSSLVLSMAKWKLVALRLPRYYHR